MAVPPGPPDAFCAVCYGRAHCITTTRFDGHHPTDKIQRISGPPGGPVIRRQHRRRSQRRIWGQELAPSRPHPPTGGTDGIQPAAGSPTTPQEVTSRKYHRGCACAPAAAQGESRGGGGRTGRPFASCQLPDNTRCPATTPRISATPPTDVPPFAPRRRPNSPCFVHLDLLALTRSRWPQLAT
jgi:hypothetical protein